MTEKLSNMLLRIMSQGAGIKEITDYAGKVYSGKLTALISTSSKLLAFSSVDTVSNQYIKKQVEQGALSETTYNLCKDDKLLDRLDTETKAFITDDVHNKGLVWIMSSVRVHNVPVAYFVVLGEQSQFSNKELIWADEFCQAFSIIISSGVHLPDGIIKTEALFINDLLNEKFHNDAEIASRMQMLGLPIYKEMRVALIQKIENYETVSDVALGSIANIIMPDHGRNILYTIYQHSVVLLLDEEKIGDVLYNDERSEKLYTSLRNARMLLGVSNPFSELSLIKQYYYQAQKAIYYGEQFSNDSDAVSCNKFSDYSLFHLLSNSNIDRDEIYHPGLYKMWHGASQQEHEEVETLFLYLRHMKNAIEVSSILHIHKNTLFYRVNKVLEATGLNINNGDDVFQIMLTDKAIHAPDL